MVRDGKAGVMLTRKVVLATGIQVWSSGAVGVVLFPSGCGAVLLCPRECGAVSQWVWCCAPVGGVLLCMELGRLQL